MQFMLDQMVRSGCRSAVMEVSSHALDQERVAGPGSTSPFSRTSRATISTTTNRCSDQYARRRTRLFLGLAGRKNAVAVTATIRRPWRMEIGDDAGRGRRVSRNGPCRSGTVRSRLRHRPAARTHRSPVCGPWGTSQCSLRLPLAGRYNVSNALARRPRRRGGVASSVEGPQPLGARTAVPAGGHGPPRVHGVRRLRAHGRATPSRTCSRRCAKSNRAG